jgi:hypothetical protein
LFDGEDHQDQALRQVTSPDLRLWKVGRVGLNPRPTDYESSPPAAIVMLTELGKYRDARSCSGQLGHVLGMIKLHAGSGLA